MKRCPKCNRVENDEALGFCRVDGAALLSDAGSSGGDASTVKLGPGQESSEIETSILPEPASTFGKSPSAATTALPVQQAQGTTHQPGNARRFGLILIPVGILLIAITVFGYFYISRNSDASIQSIAVMPFVNATDDSNLDYLSDGLTESLINNLSRVPQLAVKARSTVFRYKGKDFSPQQVGSELSVQAVLNGRVSQRGGQLSVSLDLVNARTGDQIWGQQYTRKVSDLVSLQADITNDISKELRSGLSRADREKLTKNSTTNPEAYLLYLKGRFYTSKYTEEGLEKGREYFNQAINTDPNYALAYVGLADSYITAADWFMSSKEALPRAGAAAKLALRLDDTVAEAHTSLAIVEWWFEWDWAGAEKEFDRAIALNPADPRTLEFYGWYLIVLGKFDQGIQIAKRGQMLDPLSVETNTLFGQCLYFTRRYDEASTQLQTALDMDQNYWLAHSFLGRTYEEQGQIDRAMSEFKRALELERNVAENLATLAHGYGIAGNQSEARKILDELKSSSVYVPPYNIAVIYAGLGDRDQAFVWLDRAYDDRSFYMTWLSVDPQLDRLRSDIRFSELMKRVGLQH